MVGYYPQLQEGELLYSATTRLAAAIYPGRNIPYCARRLLGNPWSTFGVLMPNNAAKLMGEIPKISGLTEDAVLDASIFHLLSPLLDEISRDELRSSVFHSGSIRGRRTFNARGAATVLKYCAECARRDADLKRPTIWRTVPNHYGSVACAEHGCLLEFSAAPVCAKALCSPSDWINLGAATKAATEAEVAIARDFEWIHAQRSSLTPGFRPIVAHLRRVLLSRLDFAMGPDILNERALLDAGCDCLSPSSRPLFAPQSKYLVSTRGLSLRKRSPLQNYCLYAYLGGTSLRRVLTDSSALSTQRELATEGQAADGPNLQFHKNRIEKFIREHPDFSRTQINSALVYAVAVVSSADREWIDRFMPESRSNKLGRSGGRNWKDKDAALCTLISDFVSRNPSTHFRSFRDALIKLGQPPARFTKANGRLPNAHALLVSLIGPKRAAA